MQLNHQVLINAGVHYGHLTRRWHPNMKPFIYAKKNYTHIIDVNATLQCLEQASEIIKMMAKSGKKILFVATKKEMAKIVETEAKKILMPYVTERWLGGMLSNFVTIQGCLKKLSHIERILKDKAVYQKYARRERLSLTREKSKLDKIFRGIAYMHRLPGALFVVDAKRETIAVLEAKKLGIPVFSIVDTNTNPEHIDYPIPGNDDKMSAVALITKTIANAIQEGITLRKQEKERELQLKQKSTQNNTTKNRKVVKVNIKTAKKKK